MAGSQSIRQDTALFYWVLLPITGVMVLSGILRHYAFLLLSTEPKKQNFRVAKEARSLARLTKLHNGVVLPTGAFSARKDHAVTSPQYNKPEAESSDSSAAASNPMSNPMMMESMAGIMKSNVALMIPQTLIMGWINTFFSGYVILKLPFSLTPQFKSMFQSGVGTKDLDVQWVSSLSWYFLTLFGLQPVYDIILGDANDPSQLSQQMMSGMAVNPNQDVGKLLRNEIENIKVIEHYWLLDAIEGRVLQI